MKTLNFMKTLFLLVAIVGLSSCGDKYYSDDYLRNSNAKLCGKTWVNDSEKNDVDEWVRHTLKFDDNMAAGRDLCLLSCKWKVSLTARRPII